MIVIKNKELLIRIGKYITACIILMMIVMLVRQYFYYKEINDNKKDTTGVVTELKYTSRGAYTLSYTYQINGKTYKNHFGVEGFIGANGKKGCVGCTFKVNYSSKDPEKSRLYLGKYERHKRTVEFFDFEDEKVASR